MRRLNPIDAQFVDAEDQDRHVSFAIASIAIFEGPAPSYEEFLHAMTGACRSFRCTAGSFGPCRCGSVRRSGSTTQALTSGTTSADGAATAGRRRELRALMARVMSARLDRDYPLWEYWLVRGLSHGRWALISKIHHSMVDGVSGTDLYRVIFDASPEPPPPAGESPPALGEPSALSLTARAAIDMATLPVRQAVALAAP